MIEVYKWNNTDYSRNGDMTLMPTSCIFKAGLDITFEIELVHKKDEIGRWKFLKKENVIACPIPWSDKQLFRIYDIKKNNKNITAYARAVFFDLKKKVLIDNKVVEKNLEDALNIILKDTKFTGHSNIYTINTSYYVRKNKLEAITSDDENSILSRWGGEILVDNYDIYIYKNIGKDRGVSIEFGKNLNEIEEDIDMDEVATRVIPVGYDGIMLDENYVDSKNINAYFDIHEKVIEYSDIKVKENSDSEDGYNTLEEAQKALIEAVNNDFDNGLDLPKVNYKVNLIDLSKTTEYKDYQILETIGLGDTLISHHKDIDIDIKARCISIEYDCITRQNKIVELGDFQSNALEVSNIDMEVEKLKDTIKGIYSKEETNKLLDNYLPVDAKDDFVSNSSLNNKLNSYALNSDLKNYTELSVYNKKIEDLEKKISELESKINNSTA